MAATALNRQPTGNALTFPLRGGAGLTVVVYAVLSLYQLFPFLLILYAVAAILVTAGLYQYCFEVAQRAANGHEDAPEVMVNIGNGTVIRYVLGQFLLYGVYAAALYWLPGGLTTLIGGVLVALAMPALVLALIENDNLALALSPWTWLRYGVAMGFDYVLLAIWCFGLTLGGSVAGDALVGTALSYGFVASAVAIMVSATVHAYAAILTFLLIGRAALSHHGALGFDVAAPTGGNRSRDPDQDALDRARALVHNGQIEAASELLAATLGPDSSNELHRRHSEILLQLGRHDQARAHAQRWLTELTLAGDQRTAWKQLRGWQPELGVVLPPTADAGLTLIDAGIAREGATRAVVDAAAAFAEHHPQHEQAARLADYAAAAYEQRFDLPERAIMLRQRTAH